MFGEDEIVKHHKGRADIIFNIIIFSFAIILGRLWYLQVYKGDQLYQYSIENRLRKENIPSPRGMILSRNNQILVHNTQRFDAIVTPQYLKNRKESVAKLAEILSLPTNVINKTLKKNSLQASYRPIVVKKNISRKEVAVIETESAKMPGISVSSFISREYTDKEVGAHLLGYISEISKNQLPRYRKRDHINYKLGDFIGQAGLEEEMDGILRGIDGYEFMEVDAYGRMRRHIRSDKIFEGIKNKSAHPGKNIRLTVDRDLQIAAFNALEGRVGSAVAVDVTTGEVLAMVSRPSFDPSKFSKGLTQAYWASLTTNINNPLLDRTIREHYAPGSTFKTITLLAALEEGIVDEHTEVNCTGKFKIGKRTTHCWKKNGHGKVNALRAIRESCDVYFYKIATKLDIDVLSKYSRGLGLGSKTGIALPRETSGLIPTKEWKRKQTGEVWQLGETLSCVIGQSYMLLTPLQLALSYASIVNGGKIMKPYIIKEIFSNSGEIQKKFKPEVTSEFHISKKSLDIVIKGLYQVVNNKKGTAYWQRGRGIKMAGKTGTSQVIRMSAEKLFSKCEDQDFEFRHHGVFAAFAPYENPQIAVGVVVEHGCHGGSAAGPVARAIITKYMEKYRPKLRKKYLAQEKEKYLRNKKKKQEKKKQEEIKKQEEKKRIEQEVEVEESTTHVIRKISQERA